MAKLIDVTAYPICDLLPALLQDKTTGKNIIWATSAYAERGSRFGDRQPITADILGGHPDVIKPRINKSQNEQQERTRKKAEVFTPVWLCNQMNNYCDEEWFGTENIFNTAHEDHTWNVNLDRIRFSKKKSWKKYVDSRRLEITCGEAPFLVSRYDAATGELIVPTLQRIGMLDRKLRVVNENAETYDEWTKWTIRAYEATYGYEYQGDNLVIARINLLLTFVDYYLERWNRLPDMRLMKKICTRIAWNIWQMDGLKDTVPLGKAQGTIEQMDLFSWADEVPIQNEIAPYCKIQDWRAERPVVFHKLKEI